MPDRTYTARALVLRRIRLKETDLIVVAIAEDGHQIRAVAKGARKPSSAFSARLELYTVVDLLLARGRGGLDIVKEARIVASCAMDASPEFSALAAPAAEAMERLTHPDIKAPKLFAVTESFFSHIEPVVLSCTGDDEDAEKARKAAVSLVAAFLLKVSAYAGFRPCLTFCACCGAPSDYFSTPQIPFSSVEGGIVCDMCRQDAEGIRLVPMRVISWAAFFLTATFDEVCAQPADVRTSNAILQICRDWLYEHGGFKMKSLTFLLGSGLF